MLDLYYNSIYKKTQYKSKTAFIVPPYFYIESEIYSGNGSITLNYFSSVIYSCKIIKRGYNLVIVGTEVRVVIRTSTTWIVVTVTNFISL